jgi:predicted nucleic acid-binding protein
VRFWDSSALTPLLVSEEDTALRERQLREDPSMLVWYGTLAEIESALNRRRREGSLSEGESGKARWRLEQLMEAWIEVQATQNVRDRALRILRVHPLRAADAFQLAAALVACEERTRGFGFLTGDRRLREAADAEGFAV